MFTQILTESLLDVFSVPYLLEQHNIESSLKLKFAYNLISSLYSVNHWNIDTVHIFEYQSIIIFDQPRISIK